MYPKQEEKKTFWLKISFHESNLFVWLCVSVILVQLMIHSHIFYVNKADNSTLRTSIGLTIHYKSTQKQEKYTYASKLHFMRATFDTYMIMCIIFFVQIMINSHIFHIDEANNRPFKTLNDLKMHKTYIILKTYTKHIL